MYAVMQSLENFVVEQIMLHVLMSVALLRAELKTRFCNVVLKTVANAPPAKRRRRR